MANISSTSEFDDLVANPEAFFPDLANATLSYQTLINDFGQTGDFTAVSLAANRIALTSVNPFSGQSYDLVITGSGISPVSTLGALEQAVIDGLASGALNQATVTSGGTEFLRLDIASGGYTLTSGDQQIEVVGNVPTSLQQLGAITTVVDSFNAALTPDAQNDAVNQFLTELGQYDFEQLILRDAGSEVARLELSDTQLLVDVQGYQIAVAANFAEAFSGPVDVSAPDPVNLDVSSVVVSNPSGTEIASIRDIADLDDLAQAVETLVPGSKAPENFISGSDGPDYLPGTPLNDFIGTGDTSAQGDYVLASPGYDTIDMTGMNQSDAFVSLDYRFLNEGINATIDGGSNTGTVDKGTNGFDTLVGIENPLFAGFNIGGVSLQGTAQDDAFDLTLDGNQWMAVVGGPGVDSYSINGDGLVRLDFRTFEGSGVSVDLGQGLVLDDGFGNQETVFGSNSIWEVRGTFGSDSIVGSAENESFILLGGEDNLDAGAGFDRLRYDRDGVQGISTDLEAGTVNGVWDQRAFFHQVEGIEYLRGSNSSDFIGDSSGDDQLEGRGDGDLFALSGGNDIITDFEVGFDLLEVSSPGKSNADVQAAFDAAIDTADGAVVDFGNGSSITFAGLSATQVQGLDPLFVTKNGILLDGNSGFNLFYGTRFDDEVLTANYLSNADTVLGSAGDDIVNMNGVDSQNGQVLLDYRGLLDPVSIQVDGASNTGSVDKGSAGTDTLLGVAQPLAAGWTNGGLIIAGTLGNDSFELAPDGEQWMSVWSHQGVDSYTINGTGLVRMDFRDAENGIGVNLASGQINDDGFGNAEVIGGTGSLWEVYGSFYDDTFTGTAGNESYRYAGGSNVLDGGDGFDRLRYDNGDLARVDANLETGIVEMTPFFFNEPGMPGMPEGAPSVSIDTVQGFEHVRGTFGGDILTGDANDNRLEGEFGNDILTDGLGNDSLFGGQGADTFTIVGGNNVISDFELGIDTLNVVIEGLSVEDRNAALESAVDDPVSALVDFGNGSTLTFNDLTAEDVALLAQPFTPPPPPQTPVAWTLGDPHLLTLDGVGYDFHAVGEFVLLRGVAGTAFEGFEVQARTAPVDGVDNVSVNVAVAARLRDGTEVMFDATDDNPLSTNGSVRLLADQGTLTLATGDQITREDNVYTLTFAGSDGTVGTADDARLFVSLQDGRLDLGVQIADNMAGQVEGLLGDGDGNSANDIALADGMVLERPLAFEDLYGQYRDDWRVTTEEQSLFTYDGGESLDGFYDPDMPGQVVAVDDFDQADVDAARTAVEAGGLTPGTVNYDNAVLDFLLTGDEGFIESSASQSVQAPETASVAGKLDVGETRVTLDVSLSDLGGQSIEGAVVGFTTGASTAAIAGEETPGIAGSYNIKLGSAASGRVDAQKSFDPSTDPGDIGVGDALDALRIALSLDPSFGPATPENLIAADVTGDGSVGVSDALDILRFVVDVETENVPRWVFVDKDADLSSVTDKGSVAYETGLDLASVDGAGPVELTGILLGNVQEVVA